MNDELKIFTDNIEPEAMNQIHELIRKMQKCKSCRMYSTERVMAVSE